MKRVCGERGCRNDRCVQIDLCAGEKRFGLIRQVSLWPKYEVSDGADDGLMTEVNRKQPADSQDGAFDPKLP
jgi:hypothetical protein